MTTPEKMEYDKQIRELNLELTYFKNKCSRLEKEKQALSKKLLDVTKLVPQVKITLNKEELEEGNSNE